MKDFHGGQVLYKGTQATELEISYLPNTIGEINSIASSRVINRAYLVASYLLPTINWNYFFTNTIGSSRLMNTGIPWYQSVNIESLNNTRSIKHPNKEEHLHQLKHYQEMRIH